MKYVYITIMSWVWLSGTFLMRVSLNVIYRMGVSKLRQLVKVMEAFLGMTKENVIQWEQAQVLVQSCEVYLKVSHFSVTNRFLRPYILWKRIQQINAVFTILKEEDNLLLGLLKNYGNSEWCGQAYEIWCTNWRNFLYIYFGRKSRRDVCYFSRTSSGAERTVEGFSFMLRV